jgi:hypothetical protein
MANREHLANLKYRVEQWKRWMDEPSSVVLHPSPQPRLRQAPVLREACGQGETEVSPPWPGLQQTPGLRLLGWMKRSGTVGTIAQKRLSPFRDGTGFVSPAESRLGVHKPVYPGFRLRLHPGLTAKPRLRREGVRDPLWREIEDFQGWYRPVAATLRRLVK